MNPFSTTLAEEIANNQKVHSLRWVAKNFQETGMYRSEDITFANTHLIKEASSYFQQYGVYNNIDPLTDPVAHKEWWDRWEYRRTHGMTLNCRVPEGGANSDADLLPIWIPPKMVGILNFGPIIRTKDEDDLSVLEAHKNTLEQRGRIETDEDLELLFSQIAVNETRDMTHDFMDFWDGHFDYWIAQYFSMRIGLDFGLVKARRKGFSYIGAWDGWDEIYMNPFVKVFYVAYDSKYLTEEGGLYDLTTQYFDFEQKFTDWKKRTLHNNKSSVKFGYNYTDSAENYGFLSSITCFSAMDNPDCLRGKQARKIKWEEIGTFPNLVQTREIAYSAAEAGGYKLGFSDYWGTVGSKDADYTAMRQMMYNPHSFEILPWENIWDKNKEGTASGMFFSQYQNLVYDKHGNTDFAKAKEQHGKKKVLAEMYKTPTQFEQWCAERATNPAEALNRQGHNIFSKHASRIQLQIDRLDTDPNIKNLGRCGKLVETKEGIRLVTNEELKAEGKTWHAPINDTKDGLPKGMDLHGCIVEWFSPYKQVTGNNLPITGKIKSVVPAGLYYIWHDPYATDKFESDITFKDSLGVAYVYEKVNGFTPSKGDRLVASWIGRPGTTDEYNHQLLLLAKYYNTQDGLLFENDRGDVYPYFKQHNALHYLMEEPEMLTLKELSGKTGRRYGISIGKNFRRIGEGARMLSDQLGTVMSTDPETGYDTTFVEYIYCKRLLKELLRWHSKANFDCVSAGIVGQYMIREVAERTLEITNEAATTQEDFFGRAFFE